ESVRGEISDSGSGIFQVEYTSTDILTQVLQPGHLNGQGWSANRSRSSVAAGAPAGLLRRVQAWPKQRERQHHESEPGVADRWRGNCRRTRQWGSLRR